MRDKKKPYNRKVRTTARLNYVLDRCVEEVHIRSVYHNCIYYTLIMMLRTVTNKNGESTEVPMNERDVMNRLYGAYTRLNAQL